MTQKVPVTDVYFGGKKEVTFPPAKPTGDALKALRAKKKRQRQSRKTK